MTDDIDIVSCDNNCCVCGGVVIPDEVLRDCGQVALLLNTQKVSPMTNDLKAAADTTTSTIWAYLTKIIDDMPQPQDDSYDAIFYDVRDIILREIQPVVKAEAERQFVERCQVALEMRKKAERYKKALQEISETSSTLRQAWETASAALREDS